MTFYCRQHPDFEGLDWGKYHDHMEQHHAEILKNKEELMKFFQSNIEVFDGRRTDKVMVSRSWGRPPKVGSWADNETERKR